uniref:NAC domain-containing protein n=1 Tax=Aegilops tauschii subsp. strangulata TaxID=200361 RepID=A0A453SFA4_AEGTS
HGVRIRNYHPAELHELYKAHKEAGSIYFFNEREFSGSARVRPGRTAKDGWWKASGGGLPLVRRGLVVGYKLTLVFYEKRPGDKPDVKTDWIVKEYTIVGPNKKVSEMALYRLYNKSENKSKEKKKKAKEEKATHEEENTPASTWAEEEEEEEEAPPSPPYPPAGGATSQAQAGQPHDYHHYYALGAAAAPGPSTSCWVPPDAGYTGLTDTVWTPDAGGTSQAQLAGQPHDYQQCTFGAAASAPGWEAPGPSSSSSSWVTPGDTKYYLQLQHAGGPAYSWEDHKLTPLVPSGPAPLAHDLPASQQHFGHQEETADPPNDSELFLSSVI